MRKVVRKRASECRNACYLSSTGCGEDLQSKPFKMSAKSVETFNPLLQTKGVLTDSF